MYQPYENLSMQTWPYQRNLDLHARAKGSRKIVRMLWAAIVRQVHLKGCFSQYQIPYSIDLLCGDLHSTPLCFSRVSIGSIYTMHEAIPQANRFSTTL